MFLLSFESDFIVMVCASTEEMSDSFAYSNLVRCKMSGDEGG
jgi:hypothetical protein